MSNYSLTHLDVLESEAIYILRETAAQFEEEHQGPVLWSATLPGPLSVSVQLSWQTEGQTWGCHTACQV